MEDEARWRVWVDVGPRSAAQSDADVANAGALAGELVSTLGGSVVSQVGARVFLYASGEDQARLFLETAEKRGRSRSLEVSICLYRWDERHRQWRLIEGVPGRARRTPPVTPQVGSITIATGERRFRTRAPGHTRLTRWVVRVSIAALALAGIVWYIEAPGVASYQVGSLFMLPVFVFAVISLARWVPLWLRWPAAAALAAAGIAGYIAIGGPQWWYWGQLAVWPLVLLVIDHVGPDGWSTGSTEGPYGPP